MPFGIIRVTRQNLPCTFSRVAYLRWECESVLKPNQLASVREDHDKLQNRSTPRLVQLLPSTVFSRPSLKWCARANGRSSVKPLALGVGPKPEYHWPKY